MNFLRTHPRFVITIAALLLLATAGFFLRPLVASHLAARSLERNSPRLVCDAPDYDFGSQETGTAVKKSFTIRNEGQKPLQILDVKSDCACTVANLPQKIVPPGESLAIDATLSLRNRRGPQRHRMTLTTDDPKQPQFVLSFKGTAASEHQLKPTVLQFQSLVEGEQASRAVDVLTSRKIRQVIPSNPELLEVRSEPLEDKGYRLHVTLKPPKRGRLYEKVRVLTDSPLEPEITLPVYAMVAGELGIMPERISLSSKQTSYSLRVSPGKVQDFKIERVEMPTPAMQAHVTPVAGKGGYLIRLTKISPSADLEGKNVRIYTDAKGMEEILVPIQVVPSVPSGTNTP